jgi:hypothetical protein
LKLQPEGRSGFGVFQASYYRHESVDEGFPVPGPSSRIRELQNGSIPLRPGRSVRDVLGDGSEDWRDLQGLEFADALCEVFFAGSAPQPAQMRIKTIDRIVREIRQIATTRFKSCQEIVVINPVIGSFESDAHGAI